MMRIRSWSCIGVMVLAGAAAPARAQVVALPQLALAPQLKASSAAAPIKPSELNGVVRDELGKPLSGAVVSALGSTSAFAVSNEDGRFHVPKSTGRTLSGSGPICRTTCPRAAEWFKSLADGRSTSSIELTRRPGESADPAVSPPASGSLANRWSRREAEERHEHDEVAWRLRHLKRSVLKEAEAGVAELDGDDSLLGDSLSTSGSRRRRIGTVSRRRCFPICP